MRYEPHRRRRRNAWVLVIVAIAVAQLTRVSPRMAEEVGRPSALERTVAALCGPLLRASYRATDGLRGLGLAVSFPRRLIAEKEAYETTAGEREAVARALWSQVESSRLRSRLVTDGDQMTYQLSEGLPALVVGRDPTGRRILYQVNRGVTSGVARGMSLTSGPDLVGTIDRVNRSTAVAYAITDRRFAAEARSLRSGDYVGTVIGDGRGALVIQEIAPGADLREGDVLVTAATTDGPPPNLRLGTVERVGLDRFSADPGSEPSAPAGTSPYRLWAVAAAYADLDAVREALIPAPLPRLDAGNGVGE